MTRYSKGARAERELLNTLDGMGYSVMRSAGSGVNSLSPDIIAIKEGDGFAFECKYWDRGSLSLDHEQVESLKRWERNTRMRAFVAWRMNGMGWYFIRPEELTLNEKSYSVTRKIAVGIGRKLDAITGAPQTAAVIEQLK
ncbi:MAG: hypothetical protein KGH98_02770 [Candidatus Micrarchaeota archaeon]|nr:hypothetical protein [Candidatus Micrarchaeota archaeon]